MATEVTKKEFDAKIQSALHINPCVNCTVGLGHIVLIEPYYGKHGIKVVCRNCSSSTGFINPHDCFVDKTRLGTPITAESLAKAIFEVVEEWNMKNPLDEGRGIQNAERKG